MYCERNSVLTVTKCDRAMHGGTYKIKLMCEAGAFEATGYVNVLDVPGKPKNFSPDEIRAEHVKISWTKPDDDGGVPITGYVVRAMDIENGDWITVAEVGEKIDMHYHSSIKILIKVLYGLTRIRLNIFVSDLCISVQRYCDGSTPGTFVPVRGVRTEQGRRVPTS